MPPESGKMYGNPYSAIIPESILDTIAQVAVHQPFFPCLTEKCQYCVKNCKFCVTTASERLRTGMKAMALQTKKLRNRRQWMTGSAAAAQKSISSVS